jgi:hypothetical protein
LSGGHVSVSIPFVCDLVSVPKILDFIDIWYGRLCWKLSGSSSFQSHWYLLKHHKPVWWRGRIPPPWPCES